MRVAGGTVIICFCHLHWLSSSLKAYQTNIITYTLTTSELTSSKTALKAAMHYATKCLQYILTRDCCCYKGAHTIGNNLQTQNLGDLEHKKCQQIFFSTGYALEFNKFGTCPGKIGIYPRKIYFGKEIPCIVNGNQKIIKVFIIISRKILSVLFQQGFNAAYPIMQTIEIIGAQTLFQT